MSQTKVTYTIEEKISYYRDLIGNALQRVEGLSNQGLPTWVFEGLKQKYLDNIDRYSRRIEQLELQAFQQASKKSRRKK